MDQPAALAVLLVVALVLLAALLYQLRRQSERERTARDDEFAVSTEGEKRCPSCGMGNMWTDIKCISCGAKLRS
jgi:hypothetical protein